MKEILDENIEKIEIKNPWNTFYQIIGGIRIIFVLCFTFLTIFRGDFILSIISTSDILSSAIAFGFLFGLIYYNARQGIAEIQNKIYKSIPLLTLSFSLLVIWLGMMLYNTFTSFSGMTLLTKLINLLFIITTILIIFDEIRIRLKFYS